MHIFPKTHFDFLGWRWKFFAVSGHVERPDVYLVPMGTTVRELIDLDVDEEKDKSQHAEHSAPVPGENPVLQSERTEHQ